MERANKLLYEWQLKGKEIQDKAKYYNVFGFASVKLAWKVRAKREKNSRFTWCAADPEQMGK